jgi:hypothetical protein
MPPNYPDLSPVKPKRFNKILLMISAVVAVVLIAILTVFLLASANDKAGSVKSELNKVISFMDSKHGETGGYPIVVVSSSDKVKINGGGSFDGSSYCVTGTSVSDESIVFHVDSAKGLQGGSCAEASAAPSVPGGLAVTFVTTEEINITWAASLYSKSYVLECSTSDKFTDPITVDATEESGTCANLKSGKLYYYRVKAINQIGNSDWSAVQKISTF